MKKIFLIVVCLIGIILFRNYPLLYAEQKSVSGIDYSITAAENDPFVCALLVADTLQSSGAKSISLSKIAMAYADVGDYNESLKISREIEEHFYKTKALAHLSGKYGQAQKIKEAEALLREALESAENVSESDKYRKFLALGDISAQYALIGQEDKAADLLSQIELDSEQLILEIAMSYADTGQHEKALGLLSKAVELAKSGKSHYSRWWSYNILRILADIALEYIKLGRKDKGSEVLQYAFEVAQTDSLIKDSPWLLEEFALKCAEAGELDLAVKVVNKMGEREEEIPGTNPEERQNVPKTAALAEIAFFYLKAGQKDMSLKLLSQALEASREIKYYKGRQLRDLLITCNRMQEFDKSLQLEEMIEPYFKSESIQKKINTDPMEFFRGDFSGDPLKFLRGDFSDPLELARKGKYIEAVRSAAKIMNEYRNDQYRQRREEVLIEIALAFAKSKQPVDDNGKKFLRAIIDQIDWKAEEHKDAIWKSE